MQRLIEFANQHIMRLPNRHGKMILLAAIAMTEVAGFNAIAIGSGYISMTRRQQQSATTFAEGLTWIDRRVPEPMSATIAAPNAQQEAVDWGAENAAGSPEASTTNPRKGSPPDQECPVVQPRQQRDPNKNREFRRK